jgi:hypothetical protein
MHFLSARAPLLSHMNKEREKNRKKKKHHLGLLARLKLRVALDKQLPVL